MIQLRMFKYEENNHFNELRTIEIDGEIWFVAADVTKLLGYSNGREAILRHCKARGVVKRDIPTSSGTQTMTLINEPNVYRLIVKSQLESAEKFEAWLFEKVLPSIRKTGSYSEGINRQEPLDFALRYMENFDHVETGYFSVINELYVRLYARLEHAGYKIPNRAIDGKQMRPDVSVGKLFATYLRENHPDICDNHKPYVHKFSDIGLEVDARQYPNEIMHIFIKFIDTVWIPRNAEKYFKERDIKALDYLPKLLKAS